jgi:hypothetical protein
MILFHDIILIMGESFKNLIGHIQEKKREPLYNSGSIFIEKFEDSKKERPKSESLQIAHPDLYDFLLKKETAKKFKVGIIHLDAVGTLSKEFASSGKNPLQIALTLRKNLNSGLIDIAKKIKEDPLSDLGEIDFLTAASRFISSDEIIQKLGFESYDIDDGEKMKFEDSSHERNLQTYKILVKNKIITKDIVDKTKQEPRPAKIVLISKQALLSLLEKETKPDDSLK